MPEFIENVPKLQKDKWTTSNPHANSQPKELGFSISP